MGLIDLLTGKKISDFKGGGLHLDRLTIKGAKAAEGSSGFCPPPWLDNRPYCLPADDQGQTSMCAAYSMAGLLEVYHWKKNRVPTTIDPKPIYAEAKRIDGNNSEGTYLESVFQAAITLGLLPETAHPVMLTGLLDVKFALHRYTVCIAGFRITSGWNRVGRDGWIGEADDSLGGHAVLLNWYSDFGSREDGVGWTNSWNRAWGNDGRGRMRIRQFRPQFMYGLAVGGVI